MQSNFLQTEIVTGYFNFLIMLGSVNMLWYVSTVVYILSIIKGIREFRTSTSDEYVPFTIIIFKGLSLLTIIQYGIGMQVYIGKLNIKFNGLLHVGKYMYNDITLLFDILKFSYLIQTLSFILFFIIYMYIVFAKDTA